MLAVVEEMRNSLKFHCFWLKLFILFDQPCWGMPSGPQRPNGLCFARAGCFVRVLGTLREGAWDKKGGPLWEPGCSGWGRRRQLTSFANCQGLQAAKPQAGGGRTTFFPTPCRLDLLWHEASAAPAPRRSRGAQVAGKGDIKRTSGKAPV